MKLPTVRSNMEHSHANLFTDVPDTVEEWKKITNEFENKWQFNHRVGAIDGKDVAMQAPPRSTSMFFNYKKNIQLY